MRNLSEFSRTLMYAAFFRIAQALISKFLPSRLIGAFYEIVDVESVK